MLSAANIKSISYLKSHAAQIAEDLEMNGTPFFITQNGEASMVIESVKHFQEKEALIAALKVIAMGEKNRLLGKGVSVAESRAQLAAARQTPQVMAIVILPRCTRRLALSSGVHAQQAERDGLAQCRKRNPRKADAG